MKFTKITRSSAEGTLEPKFSGWLQERFGECFAQISVVSTLRLKNAVKDVARGLLGYVPPEIEGWCKSFEMPPQGLEDVKFIMGYDNDEGHHQGSIERDQALIAYINAYPRHWEIVRNALALPRQKGRHASAFVLASEPISNFIPVTTVSGVKVTDFTGPEVEAVGGLKFDWLVVNALNDLQVCLGLIKDKNGQQLVDQIIDGKKVPAHRQVFDPVSSRLVDVWNLPADYGVFDDVSNGHTETVFQFNTNSAIQWLRYFNYKRPDGTPGINSIQAMAIFTALDRPGPLDYEVVNPSDGTKHNIMVEYARRIRGLAGSKDILPIFDQLLPETQGLIVFQEQLQRIYQTLTGCTGAVAEEFRSNVAKKKKEKVDAAYKFFVEQAGNKLGKENAEAVWQGLVTFAQYGFNASHATAYSIISYACAWLKHHYPLEWWCAVLRNATKDEISVKFWQHVKDLVDLPDLNRSKDCWAIVDGRVRAPVDLCLGIGETAHKQLCKYAPYASLRDFCEKIVKYRIENGEDGKWGRSAITVGTIATLSSAGIMDALFPPDTTIAERIDLYDQTLKEVVKANGGKHTKIKNRYTTPDSLARYQLKKDVLPVISEDIRPYIAIDEDDDVISKDDDSEDLYYNYMAWDRIEKREVKKSTRIVGFKELEEMDRSPELPQGGFSCAVVGYIEDQKTFAYENKSKTARKYQLDACGFKREVVQWPSDYEQPTQAPNGSIIVGIITKTKLDKGWAFRKLEVIRQPAEAKITDGEK